MKEKCSEFNFPPNISQKILDDIFGAKLGSVLVEGLIDAFDRTDFQNKLDDVVLSCDMCRYQAHTIFRHLLTGSLLTNPM